MRGERKRTRAAAQSANKMLAQITRSRRGELPWTPAEDEALKKAVASAARRGVELKWRDVKESAGLAQSRTAKVCRERWQNHLNPLVNKGEWTRGEDLRLVELMQQHGQRWTFLASQLDTGRTGHTVKNRIKVLNSDPSVWTELQRQLQQNTDAAAAHARNVRAEMRAREAGDDMDETRHTAARLRTGYQFRLVPSNAASPPAVNGNVDKNSEIHTAGGRTRNGGTQSSSEIPWAHSVPEDPVHPRSTRHNSGTSPSGTLKRGDTSSGDTVATFDVPKGVGPEDFVGELPTLRSGDSGGSAVGELLDSSDSADEYMVH